MNKTLSGIDQFLTGRNCLHGHTKVFKMLKNIMYKIQSLHYEKKSLPPANEVAKLPPAIEVART